MSISSYHPTLTEGSEILQRNDLSFTKIKKGLANRSFQFGPSDDYLSEFYEIANNYKKGTLDKQQLLQAYNTKIDTILAHDVNNSMVALIRFIISPSENHRNLLPYFHEFRQGLFASDVDSMFFLRHFIRVMSTKSALDNSESVNRDLNNDYKNMLLLMIRNKQRCQVFFDHYANELIGNINGNALWDLNLPNLQLHAFQRQFILHLISEKRDDYNPFKAWKKPESRDYIGHVNRNKLVYNHYSIDIIMTATENDQELIEALYFFVRDPQRMTQFQASGWLTIALQAQGNELDNAARLKKLLFPPSAQVKSQHWWKQYQHQFYDQLIYTKDGLLKFLRSTNDTDSLLQALSFLVEDDHRRSTFIDSGILNAALNPTNAADPLLSHIKQLLFPPSDKIMALMQAEHWWKQPWHKLYEDSFENIDEIAQLYELNSQRQIELNQEQDQKLRLTSRELASYHVATRDRWFGDKQLYTPVKESRKLYNKAWDLFKSFSQWFKSWISHKVRLTVRVQEGQGFVEKPVRASTQDHLTRAIVDPVAYPSQESVLKRRMQRVSKTAASPVADKIYTDANLRKIFDSPNMNYEIAKIIFANDFIRYSQRLIKLKENAENRYLRQAYLIGLAANCRLKPMESAFDQLVELIYNNKSYLENNSFIKVLSDAAAAVPIAAMVSCIDSYPELLDKRVYKEALVAKFGKTDFSRLIAIINRNNPHRNKIVELPEYHDALQTVIASENLSEETLLIAVEAYPYLWEIQSVRGIIQEKVKTKMLGERQLLLSHYPRLAELVAVTGPTAAMLEQKYDETTKQDLAADPAALSAPSDGDVSGLPQIMLPSNEIEADRPVPTSTQDDQKEPDTTHLTELKLDKEGPQPTAFVKQRPASTPLQHRVGPLVASPKSAALEGETRSKLVRKEGEIHEAAKARFELPAP